MDHESGAIVGKMVQEAKKTVGQDGVEAVIPGCMSLAYMLVHEQVADELAVPLLDPVSINLDTAEIWTEQGVIHSKLSHPPFEETREETLFD